MNRPTGSRRRHRRISWLFQGSVIISTEGALRLPKGLRQALALAPGAWFRFDLIAPEFVQLALWSVVPQDPRAYVRALNRLGTLHLTVEFLHRSGFAHGQTVYLQSFRTEEIILTAVPLDEDFLAMMAKQRKP